VNASVVVLVVDDDPAVRRVVVEGLDRDGMTVIEASGAAEALRIIQADRSVSVLLSDVIMPGISGVMLADRAVALRPDLKVLLFSAYPAAAARRVLEKPVRLAQICAEVRRIAGVSGVETTSGAAERA
jgi:CheY-like chemotaxis protein